MEVGGNTRPPLPFSPFFAKMDCEFLGCQGAFTGHTQAASSENTSGGAGAPQVYQLTATSGQLPARSLPLDVSQELRQMWLVISQLRDALQEFMYELTEAGEEEDSEPLGTEGLPIRSTSFMIPGQAGSTSFMKDQMAISKDSTQQTQPQPFVLGQALSLQSTGTHPYSAPSAHWLKK